MSFEDLGLHGCYGIFFSFLGVNRSGPRTSSTTNHIFIGPWDDFMVHGVNNPLYTGGKYLVKLSRNPGMQNLGFDITLQHVNRCCLFKP